MEAGIEEEEKSQETGKRPRRLSIKSKDKCRDRH